MKKYDPTIEDFYRKQIDVDGQPTILDILDTAGQDEFSFLREQYMTNGKGFILVYSVTSQASFDDCKDIYELICRVKGSRDVPIILVGNKCDLEEDRAVTKEEAEAAAQEFGNCTFIESSAKDDINVDQIFIALVRKIREQGSKKPTKSKKKCTIY